MPGTTGSGLVKEDQMSERDRDLSSDAIGRMIEIHGTAITIAPDSIATGAMAAIRFDRSIHKAGWYGCYQHMLQLARERLRRGLRHISPGRSGMFSDALQDRYPRQPRRKPDGSWHEPEYVLRNHLGEDDAWYNVGRLEQVSAAAARHARALRAETVERFGPRKDRVA
jgi:hypothetical protein